MPNDAGSGHTTEKGPTTRSASEALPKEVVPSASSTNNRKSELLEKRTPPTLAVGNKSETHKKMKMIHSPLRSSERTRNRSSSPSSDPSPTTSTHSGPKKHVTVKKLTFEAKDASEDEGDDAGTSSKLKVKKTHARDYRATFKIQNRGQMESNSMNRSTPEDSSKVGGKIDECFKGNSLLPKAVFKDGTLPSEHAKAKDRSTPEDSSKGGGKIDECFKGNSLHPKAVSKDGTLPSEHAKAKDMSAESRLIGPVKKLSENNVALGSRVPSNATTHETSEAPERVQTDCRGEEMLQILASKNSDLNENSFRKCIGHDEAENLTSSKRKSTVMDKCSDISAALVDDDNCNLIVDAGQSSLCYNIVETSGSFSKRIRGVSLSDVQRDPRKLINNVDQPSSKYNNEKSSARSKEERPQGNDDETEKIRKQQRSLYLSLKPGIAKLCEILLLPDNIKSMVENCLEYTMNNYQICTEPLSILQAFQLSLCLTAASLLRHNLDLEASLVLAKRHLNFDCKKDMVDEINARLWDMKDNFLLLAGNSKAIGSPKASESLNRVLSNTELAPEFELTEKDISKNIKGSQKRKNQWRKLLQMQQEHMHKLKKDIETEKTDLMRRSKIELATILSFSSSDVMRNEKLKVFNSEYDKRKGELSSQHEVLLKDLETKQLEARRKFQESWVPDELLNPDSSKELGTPDNAPIILLPDHVAEGKNFDNIIETMTRNITGAGFSEVPITNSSVVVLHSSPVELQAPLVKHADVNVMDIMASKGGPISGNKCHDVTEIENDGRCNIISKHFNFEDQCSDGATNLANVGEGCENFSREFYDSCGQPNVTLVLPLSNREMCDGGASDVPSGEVAPAVHKTSSSNDDSTRQGIHDGILSEPEEHIPSVSTMCVLNCEDAAQINKAGDRNGSTNAGSLNSPLSDENSKSLQEHVHGVNVMCMPNGQISEQLHEDDDNNGSNNVVTLNSTLNDERSADGNLLDEEVHVEMPDITLLSMEKISGGAVNVSVSNKVLSSTCGTASPSTSPDANAINLLNQPSLEKENPYGVSSSIPAGQNPAEVSETSHDWATASELGREGAVKMPSIVKSTDYPASAALPNSSPTDQISDGGLVDEVLSPRPCSSCSPRNGSPATIILLNTLPLKQQVPDKVLVTTTDGEIPVMVPENGHEKAECQLTDNVVVNRSTTSDHQEGVHRTMTENTLSQETRVSTQVDIVEPQEQVQPLPPVESPHSPVDILPANQSNHVSMVMEPPEQVRQLPSSGLLTSDRDLSNLHLVTGIEAWAATNEDTLSSQIPDGSTEVQNQASEQPPSNLEVDPHQAVVSPVSNMVHDSLVPGGVRAQSSEIRNLSTPGVINNHPIQTATRPASRIAPPLCHDPLSNEFERIRKLTEQHMKNHEDAKLQLKCDFEKEFEEIRRKYHIKLKETEAAFQKARENQDTQLNFIYRHKILGDAFIALKSDPTLSFPSGMQQDAGFSQLLFQLSRQQNATWPSQVATPSCGPPPAASLQSPYATTGSQTTVPPMQPAYNTSGTLSGVSARLPRINSTSPPLGNLQAAGARLPHINSTSSPLVNLQVAGARLPHINSISSPLGNFYTGGEIRAPAPHLQPYRPPTSAPSSSLDTVLHGIPGHPAPGNSSASSLSFSQWLPRTPTISQSEPHRGHWHENTSGFPTPNFSAVDLRVDANNQSSINLPNALPRMSDLASLNPSKSATSSMAANSAHEATPSDVVCLSDDD